MKLSLNQFEKYADFVIVTGVYASHGLRYVFYGLNGTTSLVDIAQAVYFDGTVIEYDSRSGNAVGSIPNAATFLSDFPSAVNVYINSINP